jgi:hypothetical protein
MERGHAIIPAKRHPSHELSRCREEKRRLEELRNAKERILIALLPCKRTLGEEEYFKGNLSTTTIGLLTLKQYYQEFDWVIV